MWRQGALPRAVIAVFRVVRFKTYVGLGGQPCAGLVPLAIELPLLVPFRHFSVSAGRRALLNSGLPEDSISFCLGVFLESGDNIQLAFKLF